MLIVDHFTVTTRVDELFDDTGSVVAELTVAVLVIVLLFPRICTLTWTIAVPPAGVKPIEHVSTGGEPTGAGHPPSFES